MKSLSFLLELTLLFICMSCSTEYEEIDHSKYQLVGTVWTTYNQQNDYYEALNFDRSTVSNYNSYENGEPLPMAIPSVYSYSLSNNSLEIVREGNTYSGTRSGDVIHIFGKDYTKQ